MRLLLDESLRRKLKIRLGPHEVRTVPEMGWAGKSNGILFAPCRRGIWKSFLTADQKRCRTSRT